MKAYVIQSGHFSKAGNFIGISALGERVHIYRRQINELFRYGQVKLPFYCMADHLTFDNTDGTTFNRLTAIQISDHEYEIRTALINSRIVSLEMDLHFCKQDYDRLQKEYDALVAKVDHYGGNAGLKEENEKLKDENERLKDEIHSLQWDNNFIQSERERLALIIINMKESVASCSLGLSQEKINQLINNA